MLVTITQQRVNGYYVPELGVQNTDEDKGDAVFGSSLPPPPGACRSCVLALSFQIANSRNNSGNAWQWHKSLSYTFCPTAISTAPQGRMNYSHFIDEKTESLSDF